MIVKLPVAVVQVGCVTVLNVGAATTAGCIMVIVVDAAHPLASVTVKV